MPSVEELRNALWQLLEAEQRYRASMGGQRVSVNLEVAQDLYDARAVALELLKE